MDLVSSMIKGLLETQGFCSAFRLLFPSLGSRSQANWFCYLGTITEDFYTHVPIHEVKGWSYMTSIFISSSKML